MEKITMKIDWKARLTNKVTLTAIAAAVVTAGFQVANLVGATPMIEQEFVMQGVGFILTVLMALGIVVDPTTPGIGDNLPETNLNQESNGGEK